MSKKNKPYGFPYDYSNLKPIHAFINDDTGATIKFFRDATRLVMLQTTGEQQQRLFVDSTTMTNMMTRLDRTGWKEMRC